MVSLWLTGDRAETSYPKATDEYGTCELAAHTTLVLTNDRRYESKDSRDIENGSFSLTRLR